VESQVQTGWVVLPKSSRALDHLGVQATCNALYAQLVPGITNSTDRARYYSFYPWLLWSFDKRYSDRSYDACRRVLRRAECLLALVAAYHETIRGEGPREHSEGTVGRGKLGSRGAAAADGSVIDLELAAEGAPPSEKPYFSNGLGGLGQYYFAPLRGLQILANTDHGGKKRPSWDPNRGAAIAKAFDEVVPGDRFFEVLEGGTVGARELDDLLPFCPCSLKASQLESKLLLDVFLARTNEWKHDGGLARRASFGLLLDLVHRHGEAPDLSLEALLRGAAYAGALADGTEWAVPKAWSHLRDAWGVYVRNEILSVALQGLLWAQLRAIQDAGGQVRTTADAASLLREAVMAGLDPQWHAASVGEAVGRLRASLPDVRGWAAPEHEIRRMWRIESCCRT
jgi:hypothetical protein